MGYNLLINGIYWWYKPLILTIDPNFLGHPSMTMTSKFQHTFACLVAGKRQVPVESTTSRPFHPTSYEWRPITPLIGVKKKLPICFSAIYKGEITPFMTN